MYLGYRTAFGASLRYFIQAGEPAKTLGCLQFSSPAWCMQARERWIGWSPPARKKNLQHIVNQSRFLILPWVKVPNLASHVLAAALRTVAPHWHERFGIEPLLLETLIDPQRFHGGCYRAANWIQTGLTTGRGRQDPHHQRHGQCPKLLFLYPLVPDARQRLQSLH